MKFCNFTVIENLLTYLFVLERISHQVGDAGITAPGLLLWTRKISPDEWSEPVIITCDNRLNYCAG